MSTTKHSESSNHLEGAI